MALRFLLPVTVLALFLFSCGEETNVNEADSAFIDSMLNAHSNSVLDTSAMRTAPDTEFHTALPTVFDGDIIMQNIDSKQTLLMHDLMGGKYNHVGLIYQRKKDGILMVIEMRDSVRMTPLTEFVDRSGGHVCVLRLKEANKTLTEEKVKALREAAKVYKDASFDPVLNWDDSHLYNSELVWKIYNNAMRLTLCPTRKVSDFNISTDKQNELAKTYGGVVSPKDEAVSLDDIYNSQKLEIIHEK
jgi:hypothetical protein